MEELGRGKGAAYGYLHEYQGREKGRASREGEQVGRLLVGWRETNETCRDNLRGGRREKTMVVKRKANLPFK